MQDLSFLLIISGWHSGPVEKDLVGKYKSQRDRRIANYKPFSVNAVGKGGEGPILRYWLEQIVSSFGSL